MSYDIVQTVTSAAVATGGTVTFNYPANRDAGFYLARGHRAFVRGLMAELALGTGYTLTFGTSNITFTYLGATSIPANSNILLELNGIGANSDLLARTALPRVGMVNQVELKLGAPDAAVATAVCASQALNTGVDGVVNGTLAVGGAATFDVPRNIVAAWTSAAVITITGTDEYGNVVVESSASGTALAGKKAFKKVTKVRVSANVTGLTVGNGDVLGLPIVLNGTADVLREKQDGAAATAGTLVAAVASTPSATTGDVRGTYDPNAACDGAKAFSLVMVTADPTDKGLAQFAG